MAKHKYYKAKQKNLHSNYILSLLPLVDGGSSTSISKVGTHSSAGS